MVLVRGNDNYVHHSDHDNRRVQLNSSKRSGTFVLMKTFGGQNVYLMTVSYKGHEMVP